MPLDNSIKFRSIYNEIDMNSFIDFGFGKDVLTTGILEMIKENISKYNFIFYKVNLIQLFNFSNSNTKRFDICSV